MHNKLAKLISYILHPILMPLYMAILVIFAHPQQFTDTSIIHNEVRLMYYGALTVFFPLFSFMLMWKLDVVSSFDMSDGKERFIPLIALATFWLWAYFLFKEEGLYRTSSYFPLGLMTLGCIFSLFILFPLNFVANTSWHLVGIGGLISLILNIMRTSQYNLVLVLIAAIILLGLLASARLSMNLVNKNGLMIGFLIGFFGQFFAFQVWGRLL
ncbi:MAG: hypothetical protein ISR01_00595 [Chitinophagales bacterium]|jgi:hypothetical protein|nr:hypothetical protein [Chitinophagales bacterium]